MTRIDAKKRDSHCLGGKNTEKEFYDANYHEDVKLTRDLWITSGLWNSVRHSVAYGTKPYTDGVKVPTRMTKDGSRLTFEFVDGRWFFAGVMGD